MNEPQKFIKSNGFPTNFNTNMKKRRNIEGKNRKVKKGDLKLPGQCNKVSKLKKTNLNKFDNIEGVIQNGLKTKYHKKLWQERDKQIELASRQSARTMVLLNEQDGYIDTEGITDQISQSEIVNNVDIISASKHFNLNLNEFGPYKFKYNENGRHLLLAGKKGHVSAINWITKHLSCEINVMEEITNLSWLHNESMFAVAQKSYVHIYDSKGIQLHCIKRMNATNFLEFLPYHFLLVGSNEDGYLSWLDVSIGEIVAQYNSKLGRIAHMCQDKSSGLIYTGDTKGIVSLWCPSVRDPLAQVSCHNTPISALAVNPSNQTFLTSDISETVKVWDIRNLGKSISVRKFRSCVSEINVSQKGITAFATGNVCQMYQNPSSEQSYLRYAVSGNIKSIQFCPYEDVLGISTNNEFASILVPGSAESNFDALESNPYQSKSQRKEIEVRKLLDKIPMEMISLNPNKILEVNKISFKEKLTAKKKILFIKPQKVDFNPRQKKKSKNSLKTKRKQIVRETAIREFKKNIEPLKKEIQREKTRVVPKINKNKKNESVLDRFKNKSRLQ